MECCRIPLLMVVAATFGWPLAGAAQQAFPAKAIRIFVPYPPGGSPDVLARVVADKATEPLGHSVIVENRPGAAGMVAVNALQQADPDGHTLLLADSSVYSISPSVNRTIASGPTSKLVPVTYAATSPIYLIVNPGLKANNLEDFLAIARSKADLPYGSSGNGTAHHLAMELLKHLGKVRLTHVPYKGAAATVPAVISGDVVAGFAGWNLAHPQARAGKVTVLGIAEGKRSVLTPDVPTLAEQGLPGYDITISLGLFAPASTPRGAIDKLNSAFIQSLKAPESQQRLLALGVAPVGAGPDEFAETIRKEIGAYGRIVDMTGTKPE